MTARRLALGPRYDPDGDLIEVHVELANSYGRWLGHGVTVYLAREDDRVVGFAIGDVRRLMRPVRPLARFRRWLRGRFVRPRPRPSGTRAAARRGGGSP